MNFNEPLLGEFKFESVNTRKMLERVPAESLSWQPHAKSMSLLRLSSHIADIPSYLTYIIYKDELNFAGMDFKPKPISTTEELVQRFDDNLAKGIEALKSASNEKLMASWKLSMGDREIFNLPRIQALRSLVFNHIIHHRGQLSVFLRLLNAPVPGMYGPSADEM